MKHAVGTDATFLLYIRNMHFVWRLL